MKREIRKDLIEKKLVRIMDSVDIVSKNLPIDFKDFKESGLIKDGIYKKIEFAIESIIDILNIINADLGLGMPESDENIIEHIENAKIFDKKTINLIREMKRFRNILIHRYEEIDDGQAFETIKDGVKDFELIINEFEKFLKNNK